ncbi:metalloregulator ArsR/SmtB family transcription factor [Scytonema sp. UIC 10036]|uniref:ArsR/SmtB family transcription factor n=1 Tax=Scytonema sp. UIC 10036 TaxID=2304196 RepID=UPI00325A477A
MVVVETFPSALAQMADYFKVLSEVSRLQILCCLKSGSKNVTEIIELTGLGQANVSKHLKILSGAGVVMRSPQGANVFYEIADPMIFQLCDLVYQSLSIRLEEKEKQLELLKTLRS